MASEETVIEQPEVQFEEGPGPRPKPTGWIDSFNSYLTKNPNATDDELFEKFPELGKDHKRLDGALSYVYSKSKGISDEEAKKLYPDLLGPAGPYISPKNKVEIKGNPDVPETPAMPKLDLYGYENKVKAPVAAESTAMPAIKQQIKAEENAEEAYKKIQAKYKPMMDKVMTDIEANKDHFVENRRPALDFHPDAPESFYEVPKMSIIDDYLKRTIPDATDRYYIRNKIIHQFQENKDSYNVDKLAEKQIDELPAIQKAKADLSGGHIGMALDQSAVLRKAQEIDPEIHDKVNTIYQGAYKKNEDIKNETTRNIINNSTSLEYDENGNLKKINPLDINTPGHDQITGASKALQGIFKFSGQVGQMASGILKFFGAKNGGYNLQTLSDDFTEKNAFPGGKQTASEFLAGDALPMILQGAAMGKVANLIGTPAFKALSGAAAKGFIGKMGQGALGGVALAPINSALISHDYYTQLVRAGEAPEIARAKAEHVFDKNIVTDMLISPLQFGIMNAPVRSAIAKGLLKFGVSPVISGGHFMLQDYFQQKENNPALTAWQYATSDEGIKTGITGALTGLIQHAVIGKMNDWQTAKDTKDAFSFGRRGKSPETAALPNDKVLANIALNAFEMKEGPRRADELKNLVSDLQTRGVYTEAEANKIYGIIDDVAAVKPLVPKLGTAAQRMAVFNELLNKRSYESQIPDAGNSAVVEMLQGKMKESDARIQKIMNEEEPLYFINGIETSKEQLQKWVDENPEEARSNSVKIEIINDDDTKQAIQDAKNKPIEPVQQESGSTETPASEEVQAEAPAAAPEKQTVIEEKPADGTLLDENAPVPDESRPVLPGRSPEFSEFYHSFKDEISNTPDSSFDFRIDLPMDQKSREGAIRDIEAGKNTKRATLFLDELQKQHDAGMIEFTRGRGNHVEKFGIPVEEWRNLQQEAEPEVLEHIESGHFPDHELAKWLQEEADKIHDDATDQSGDEGHAAGDHEAGTSEGELLHQVRQVDENKAGDSPHIAENEPRSAGHSAERPVRASGEEQGSGKVQGEAAEDLEESQAVSELSKLLGRKPAKMDRISGDTIKANGTGHTVEQYLTRAKKVLTQLFPDHEIRPYHTEAEYMDKEKRPAGSAGVYDPNGKYIAFNLERIKKSGAENTIFHEVIHPIVREALQSRPGAVDAAYSKLNEMKAVKGMEAVWEHEEHYRSRGIDTMKVEAITEFLSHVADGRIDPEKFSPSVRTKIVDAFNRILKALGIHKTISTSQDIRRLADSIKSAFAEGDATPIKEALGRRDEGVGNEKMESLKPDDSEEGEDPDSLVEKFVRERINEYKETSLIKALREAAGMSESDAKSLIVRVRDEQNMTSEDIIRQAMAIGAGKIKGAGKQIASASEAGKMKPGLLKTLRRWYFDGVDEVSDVKSIIRKNKGKEEFEIDKIYHATRKLVNFWNKVPKVKQMAFILGVEKPELLAGQPEQVQDMAADYRQRLNKTFETIGKVIPDLNYIEDYFPHFWEKPEQARNYFANTLSKAPMEGSKSFAKKRFFETIVAGLKEGYKLKTTNPEEMVRLAEANAWKFKTAHDIINDMKGQGYLKMYPRGEQPEGWQTVDDPIFGNMAMRSLSFKEVRNVGPDLFGDEATTKPKSKMAALYMPQDVAKLVNEYLGPGLKGPVKNFIQQYNNIKNLFQLGVGFFHFGTTTLDSMVSGMTNGIQKLTAGNVGGLLDIATLGNLPATVVRGFKAKSEWNKGKFTADTQALMDANAKVGRQKMYALDTKYNMMKAFGQLRADADFKQIPKVLWNALLFLPESINKPLMEHWVPALKVGGYLRALDSEVASRKGMTPTELQTARQKIWDSMDDRLGQVVYDNVFMKKAFKDLAFMMIRSAGWTGGTIRATSGGLAEIPRSAQRLVRGQGLSQRTAYLAALPLTVGIMGGFLHYLMTGNPPDELRDYFFPKDGTKSADGTDHRLVLPSYMKDILAYSKEPVRTLLHKTSPLLNDVVELYNNKDFYGERLYNTEDPFYQKGLDILQHEAVTMEPFSFRTDPNAPDQTTSQWWLQKFGITNAPREREKSEIQNKISKAYSDQIGKDMEGKTHAEMEQQIARKHLRNFIFAGGEYKDASQEWKDKAAITPQALQKFIHDSKMDPYERYFKQLKADTKLKLYQEMSDEDKEKYGKWIPVSVLQKANQPKTDEE